MEQRIIELEARYTEQQALLDDLSQVLYAQQRVIDALLARVDQLEKKTAAEPAVVDAPGDEVPPHY